MPLSNRPDAKAVCDRCGLTYEYGDLRYEAVRGRKTGMKVCQWCFDEDHPQNWQGSVKVQDAQALEDPRPDLAVSVYQSLFGWKPVGHPTTGETVAVAGKVTVVTEEN